MPQIGFEIQPCNEFCLSHLIETKHHYLMIVDVGTTFEYARDLKKSCLKKSLVSEKCNAALKDSATYFADIL